MKNFNVYKKRDGQSWKEAGQYFCSNFEEAKKEFARNCWNDLLEGKHGYNFRELTIEDDYVETEGIYYNGELFFEKASLETGIENFREDVYTWEIRNSFLFEITDQDGDTSTEEFESIEQAKEIYPDFDAYKIKQID